MKAYWTMMAINRLQRLQQVHEYLASEKEPVTILIVERLARLAEGLCRDPEAGYPLPYFGDAEVRELVDRSYRIVYRVLEEEIHILTVRHVPRVLPERAYEP
jgi:plasmid stabilization system protein ParE